MPNFQKLYTNERTLTVIGEKVKILKQPTERLINTPPLKAQSLINIRKIPEKSVKSAKIPTRKLQQQIVSLKSANIDEIHGPLSIFSERYRQIQQAYTVDDFLKLLQQAGQEARDLNVGTGLKSATHAQRVKQGCKNRTTIVKDVDSIIDSQKIYYECFQSHFDKLKNIRTYSN